jgi:hypothetical protein
LNEEEKLQDINQKEEMGTLARFVGIFMSPKETCESLDRKPTWLAPFIFIVVLSIVLYMLALDIGLKDRLADMEARDLPAEQIERAQSFMEGPMKYVGVFVVPISMLIVVSIIAGILMIGCNTLLGGDEKFKKVFSLVMWVSLIPAVGGILKTFLIMSKGTTRGVTTSLAIMLPLPEIGEKSTMLFRFFERLDLFSIWQLCLWIIGLAVIYRFPVKKTAAYVLSLWVIYCIAVVLLGSLIPAM